MATERETFTQPLHQSSVNTCLRCKRCYMFKYRWCIVPKKRPFLEAPSLGRMLHRLIQLGPSEVQKVKAEANEHITKLIGIIDSGGDLMGELTREVEITTNQLDKALAMATILWEKYPRPKNHKVLGREKTIEATFRLSDPARNDIFVEAPLKGILDEIVEDETGKIWIRDYKTSSRDVSFTLTGYQYGLQCRIYRLLAGAYLQGLAGYENRSPEGFILEVLQTPTIVMCNTDRDYEEVEHTLRSGPRKGQTEIRRDYYGEPKFDRYLSRVREWYKNQGDNAVQSFAIMFGESVLPQELRMDLMTAAVYRLLPATPDNFPRDTTGSYCTSYERVCPYYNDLCSRDPASWDATIEEKFEVVKPESSDESQTTEKV